MLTVLLLTLSLARIAYIEVCSKDRIPLLVLYFHPQLARYVLCSTVEMYLSTTYALELKEPQVGYLQGYCGRDLILRHWVSIDE